MESHSCFILLAATCFWRRFDFGSENGSAGNCVSFELAECGLPWVFAFGHLYIDVQFFLHVSHVAGFAGKVPAEQGYIPDLDGLVGRARQEAVVRKAFGEELYDREAPAFFEEGTRENPIPILSVENERIVGVSLPVRAILFPCSRCFVGPLRLHIHERLRLAHDFPYFAGRG